MNPWTQGTPHLSPGARKCSHCSASLASVWLLKTQSIPLQSSSSAWGGEGPGGAVEALRAPSSPGQPPVPTPASPPPAPLRTASRCRGVFSFRDVPEPQTPVPAPSHTPAASALSPISQWDRKSTTVHQNPRELNCSNKVGGELLTRRPEDRGKP